MMTRRDWYVLRCNKRRDEAAYLLILKMIMIFIFNINFIKLIRLLRKRGL